ncbi:MAG TPA: aspartate aminotransferase family protein [Firmicutes bacterium]|jgi:adenosylmethionine-8-amino-7-oxononanoate aminotransferase|nr:aspartate aminotransferase family protein [Bacillota bacterium]
MNKKLDEKIYHIWHPFTNMNVFYEEPLIFTEGHGSLLKDVNNKTYINALSGLWNTAFGLGDQEVIDAITAQLKNISYASLFRMGHAIAQRYAEKLFQVLPGNLSKVFFTSNGSEAVETMIKATRQFYKLQGKHGKMNIICLRRAYHGVSYGALSASGFTEDQEMYAQLLPGFIHIEPPYCYRCPYHRKVDDCQTECAREIENVIQKVGIDKIAAFMMEPILGFGGFIVPPDKFHEELIKILRKYDILLLMDEVTTGFGRTGKFFACEHWGLSPDMMALGKAISGGYIPLGATVFSEEIYHTFLRAGVTGRFAHGSTYSGNPAACAAGEKMLEIYQRADVSAKA